MIENDHLKPLPVFFCSLIPGLAVALLGKTVLALAVFGLVSVSLLLVYLFPSLVTWYLFSGLYFAQMVYSISLARWLQPARKTDPEVIQFVKGQLMPVNILNAEDKYSALMDMLADVVSPGEEVIEAVIGKRQETDGLEIIAATEDHLILAPCTEYGKVISQRRIPRGDVDWVALSITYAENRLGIFLVEENPQELKWSIPSVFREQAIELAKEFPGGWDQDFRNREGIRPTPPPGLRGQKGLVLAVGIMMVLISFLLVQAKSPVVYLLRTLLLQAGFTAVLWPSLDWHIRQHQAGSEQKSVSILHFIASAAWILWIWLGVNGFFGSTVIRWLALLNGAA